MADTSVPFLTPKDIAGRLRTTSGFVYAEIKRGRLKAHYFGRLPRVAPEAFEAYVAGARR